MAAFDRDQLRDKILGCWAGKNIGGTVATEHIAHGASSNKIHEGSKI